MRIKRWFKRLLAIEGWPWHARETLHFIDTRNGRQTKVLKVCEAGYIECIQQNWYQCFKKLTQNEKKGKDHKTNR